MNAHDTTNPPGHGQRPRADQRPPLAAIILAAGLGQRLGGRPKATLQIGGISMLERLVAALRGAGIQDVSVIIGPYREQLLPLVAHCGASAVEHRQPGASLVDSQRLALDAHRAGFASHDLLLVLADLPLLSAADMSPLVAVQSVHCPRRAYVTDVDTPDDLAALQALVHPALVAWPAQSPCSAAGASRPAPSISVWPPAPDPLDPPTD